jgi:hypothetical protein
MERPNEDQVQKAVTVLRAYAAIYGTVGSVENARLAVFSIGACLGWPGRVSGEYVERDPSLAEVNPDSPALVILTQDEYDAVVGRLTDYVLKTPGGEDMFLLSKEEYDAAIAKAISDYVLNANDLTDEDDGDDEDDTDDGEPDVTREQLETLTKAELLDTYEVGDGITMANTKEEIIAAILAG